MDKKISELGSASAVLSTDFLPIVSGTTNYKITTDVLFGNTPKLGNKGLSKNVVGAPIGNVIPLTYTLVLLPTSGSAYTLGAGVDGQNITVISNVANSMTFVGGSKTTATFSGESSITLTYINSLSKWIINQSYNTTLT